LEYDVINFKKIKNRKGGGSKVILEKIIKEKISSYVLSSGLMQVLKDDACLVSGDKCKIRKHSWRVALLAEEVARISHKQVGIAFIAGLLHDIGKLRLDVGLFKEKEGECDKDVYEKIKMHARLGYEFLREKNIIIALIVGCHHLFRKDGYGISKKDFPCRMGLQEMKSVMDFAVIVSICDFIDSNVNRNTTIKNGDNGGFNLLPSLLEDFYPGKALTINVATNAFIRLNLSRDHK